MSRITPRRRSTMSLHWITGVFWCACVPWQVAASSEYQNPILPGDWSDPAVIRVGEDYYTCRSSFGWQPGIPIAHSRDLIHWHYIGYAFRSHPKLRPGDTSMTTLSRRRR